MSEFTCFCIGVAAGLFIIFLSLLMIIYPKDKTVNKKEDNNSNAEISNYIKKTIQPLTTEQIEEIHKKGFITPEEKLKELEGIGICAPGDAIGSAAWRCKLFRNCHDCLCDYVASKEEWEQFDFKLVNSINIKEKDLYVKKLE